MNHIEFEKMVDSFEATWPELSRIEVDKFLNEHCDEGELLLELIHADLELRLKSGEAARIESYIERFPELSMSRETMTELIRAEHGIRERREPDLRIREYVLRFPEYYYCLLDAAADSKADREPSMNGEEFAHCNQFSRSYATTRFSMEKMHAEGGLGNVWLAHDHELHRKVALKEIKNKHANDPIHKSRFVQEAIITGFLDHPGVVPVHSLGHFRDGRLYYTMRLVRGTSLRDRIRNYHDSLKTGDRVTKTDLAFRRLVQHFLDACNTVDYAHIRGVVHRDIKPDNIMIGEYGETLVVDWGLAKLIDPDEIAEFCVGELIGESFSGIHQMETDCGQVIGSPAFMSPEQAAGDLERVGIASDVYSLGASLFTLVTNQRPPAPAVQEPGRYRRLKETRFRVSRDLVPLISICRKAMAYRAEDRFSSAKQLAENVESFLADAPVAAHKESMSERFARVARRYQTLVRAAAIAACLVAVISTIAAFWINSERQKAADAATLAQSLAESERNAKTSALRSRNSASKIQDMLSNLFLLSGPTNRGQIPDIEENLVAFRELIEESDPLTKARGYDVLARFYKLKGQHKMAIDLLEKAFGLVKNNCAPDSDQYIATLTNLASVFYDANYESQGIKLARRADALAGTSQDAGDATKLSIMLLSAEIACDQENYDEAIKYAKNAQSLATQAYDKTGGNSQFTAQWLIVMNQLAGVLIETGDSEDFSQAKVIFDRLLKVQNEHQLESTRCGLTTLSNLGNWHRIAGDDESSVDMFRQVAERRAEILGQYDIETLKAESLLGNALYHQASKKKSSVSNNYEEAITTLETALTKQCRHLGWEHPEAAKTTIFLSTAWRKSREQDPKLTTEDERRIGVLRRIIDSNQELRGSSDFSVLRLKNQLALYYQQVNDWVRSDQLFSEIMKGLSERRNTLRLTSLHSKEKDMMANYSARLISKQEYHQAFKVLQRLVQDDEQKTGASKPGRLFMLGVCCSRTEQLESAIDYLIDSCDGFQRENLKRRMSKLEFAAHSEYVSVLQQQNRITQARDRCQELLSKYRERLSLQQVQAITEWSEQLEKQAPASLDSER